MSENLQFWGRMYFPTKYIRTYPPKSPQNLILGDLSMRNQLYREPSVSCTLKTVRSCIDYVVKQLVSRLAHSNIVIYATGVWAELHKNVTRSPLISGPNKSLNHKSSISLTCPFPNWDWGVGRGLCPLPRKFLDFLSWNSVIWCIWGVF